MPPRPSTPRPREKPAERPGPGLALPRRGEVTNGAGSAGKKEEDDGKRTIVGRARASHQREGKRVARVWIDGALQDRTLTPEFAAPLEWGRRRLSGYLRARAFGDAGGDAEMDAVVLVALLGVFGPRPRPDAEVDAAAHIIERGLFGR